MSVCGHFSDLSIQADDVCLRGRSRLRLRVRPGPLLTVGRITSSIAIERLGDFHTAKTQSGLYPSGIPAKRIPSQTRLRLSRKIGLSLGALSRKRRTVKVGSSESPAFAAPLA